MIWHSKSKSGFTLIELLTVISVIGLLSSIALASLNSARIKARDAYIVRAAEEVRTAVELYKAAHNGSRPSEFFSGVYDIYLNDSGNVTVTGTLGPYENTATDLAPYLPVFPHSLARNKHLQYYHDGSSRCSNDADFNPDYLILFEVEDPNNNLPHLVYGSFSQTHYPNWKCLSAPR